LFSRNKQDKTIRRHDKTLLKKRCRWNAGRVTNECNKSSADCANECNILSSDSV